MTLLAPLHPPEILNTPVLVAAIKGVVAAKEKEPGTELVLFTIKFLLFVLTIIG